MLTVTAGRRSACISSFRAQQSGEAFALTPLAFKNAGERLGQQCIEPCSQDVDQHGLSQRFGFDRLMRSAVLVTAVTLYDGGEGVFPGLLLRQREPLPAQRGAAPAFKKAPGIALDLAPRQIEITQVDDAVAGAKLRRDLSAQKAAALAIGGRNTGAVVPDDIPQHASERAALGQDHRGASAPWIEGDVRQLSEHALLDRWVAGVVV